ncbi:chlorophyllase-1 [Dorcoceras hygrometricum]|uniref:Chlorophyllase-1 n=1 Tax=Dorcoceras hygrometricum TaxID=472368 RepID=A0A2Z7CTM8_9LAMI|nr:chlorophyllase-1 [Dorcoceras hygrometricum]
MELLHDNISKAKSSVFTPGNLKVKTIKVKKSNDASPPSELFVVTPVSMGAYPVILFCHGYCTANTWYSHLLQHISSHGFIIVAPQFYQCLIMSMKDEIKIATKVTNWLSTGLETILPENLKPDLSRLALLGHSRGGKTAFSLALNQHLTSLKFKALLGMDPVAGPSPPGRVEPEVLTYIPQSFNLSLPVGIIGTGLSNKSKGIIPSFAPNGINHAEFFNESKPPAYYFLAKDYGHCDILDDSKVALASLLCKSGKGSKELMRNGVGGIIVAFLKAYLAGENDNLQSIVDAPSAAPITLGPVIYSK